MFFEKIFIKCCFSPSAWCSTQQCLVALTLDGRNTEMQAIYERHFWTSRVDMKQLWKDYTVREQKDALHELEKLYKEQSTVVRKHNGVFSSWPPVLPFSGKDVCQSGESVPCCPSAKCRLSLHCGSALNQSTYTVHFHRFLLCSICTLNSIISEACQKHVLFLLDWLNRVNVCVQ